MMINKKTVFKKFNEIIIIIIFRLLHEHSFLLR